MVSRSTSTVSTTRHISISCCQSRLLRAKRETSRAATAPTLPRQTSATIRSKPARVSARGRAAEVIVDDLDLGPAERSKTLAHRVLQCPALAIVQDLVARGLTHVEDRPAIQMMLPNLVRHHRPPASGSDNDRHGRDRAGAAPASPSPPDVSLPAALATTGPADRSPPAPADRIDRAAGLARGRSRDVDFD